MMFENRMTISFPDRRVREIKLSKFNAGELNFNLSLKEAYQYLGENDSYATIKADVVDSDGILAILLANDAIKRVFPDAKVKLIIPYLPYARQDRVCNYGESFGLKIICDIVNSCNFYSVEVWDCHSDVGVALLNNCTNVHVKDLIGSRTDSFCRSVLFYDKNVILVSPDSGSLKKTYSVAEYFSLRNDQVVQATKYRDVATGQLSNTMVFCDDLEGKNCVIVDDICENGGTFLLLAEKLKRKGAGDLHLFTTHGIYPNGKQHLLKAFTTVECANEFQRKENN